MAKYRITPSSRTIVQSPISIGHKAEKGVEAIEFDVTAWVEIYGSGTLTVIMRRWGDAIPYPIALEIDENNKATWTLSDTDTAKAGMAYAQLSYIVGETVVKKSDIYTFRVMDSLTGEGDPPEAYESWLEHLTHFAAEAMAEVLDIEGIVTDKTLTVDGGIADAKATGDALSALEDQFTEKTDQLKADLRYTETPEVVPGTFPTESGGVNGEIGEAVTFDTVTQWRRYSFVPEEDTEYRIQFTNRPGLSTTAYYIFALDENDIVLGRYGAVEPTDTYTLHTESIRFGANVKKVWCKSRTGSESHCYKIIETSEVLSEVEEHDAEIETLNTEYSKLRQTVYDEKSFSESIWESGTFNAATGNNTTSTYSLRTKSTVPVNVFVALKANTGYKFNTYGWANGSYIGFYNGTVFTKSGSALLYFGTERTSEELANAGATDIKIVFRKDEDVVPDISETLNLSYSYDTVKSNNKSLDNIGTVLNMTSSIYDHGAFDIKRCDFSAWYSGEQADYTAIDFNRDTTYADVITAFDGLMSAHRDYITKNALGTASGTDLNGNPYTIYEYVFKPKHFTHFMYPNKMPKIYMDGSIHGFEKSSTYGLYFFLKDVTENWEKNESLASVRRQVELHIIPVLNPYGFDRNDYLNGNLVNINRNFDHPGEWTVNPQGSNYNGLAAFDQPESAIARDWLLAGKEDILMYFDCHTNGNYSTTGYNEMNPCMTSNDRNDAYYNKLIGVFTNHIEEQTLRFPAMYNSIAPSATEFCGMITTSATIEATKGTASTWANTMQNMLSMTLETFNALKNADDVLVIGAFTSDALKINSEIIGNMVIQILKEYAPY